MYALPLTMLYQKLNVFHNATYTSKLGKDYNSVTVNLEEENAFQSRKSWRELQLFSTSAKEVMLNLTKRIEKQLILHQRDALLTLFTTWTESKQENYFKPDSKIKNWSYNNEEQLVHNLTIRNWLLFHPFVIPVLFATEAPLAEKCRRQGWDVRPVIETAADGVPVLKNMFLDAMSNYNTMFYAYSNGDILYTNSLLETLVSGLESFITLDKPAMLVGKRTNIDHVTNTEGSSWQNIAVTAKRRGELFSARAEDYFITTPSYPWEDIPPLVIGRLWYDNWLVYNARKQGHLVIDATITLLAVHQTTSLGNYEKHRDAKYNGKVLKNISKEVPYGRGRTDCTEHYTTFNRGSIILKDRRGYLVSLCRPI